MHSLLLHLNAKSIILFSTRYDLDFHNEINDLSQLQVPAEAEKEFSSPAMIDCTVSFWFFLLIVGVILYLAPGLFSWSCIFPYKCAKQTLDFKIILRFTCSIPLLQNIDRFTRRLTKNVNRPTTSSMFFWS